jgi:hypothetical protein
MRRITIIAAVAASIAALIGVAALLRAGAAGANNEAARLRWAFVDPHGNARINDATGIDVLDAHGRRALTRRSPGSSASYGDPRWSPDGRVVAFARSGDGDGLYIVGALAGGRGCLCPGVLAI